MEGPHAGRAGVEEGKYRDAAQSGAKGARPVVEEGRGREWIATRRKRF